MAGVSTKEIKNRIRSMESTKQITKARLSLGERIVAVLKQKNNAPVEVAHQVCILYAVVNGYLKDVSVDKIPEYQRQLHDYMEQKYPQVLSAIRSSGKLETDTEEALRAALHALTKEFLVQI